MQKNKRLQLKAETNNSAIFNEADELEKRSTFSRREVGLTHPDNSSFIRITDTGAIEIFAGEELGLIISPETRSISIFADVVKIFSNEDNGMRWNGMSFNYAGDSFQEPALLPIDDKDINAGFNNARYYLNGIPSSDSGDQEINTITIKGDYAYDSERYGYNQDAPMPAENANSGLTDEQIELLEEYSMSNIKQNVDYMRKLMQSGYTFEQAKDKTLRDKGV